MMNRRKISCFLLSLFLFLFSTLSLNAAGNATFSFTGNGTAYVGDEITLTLNISVSGSDTGGVDGIEGTLNYNNLKYIKNDPVAPSGFSFALDNNSKIFTGFGTSKITSSANLTKITFKAENMGTATVSCNGLTVNAGSDNELSARCNTKTINIINRPSGNTNLKSLSASGTNISLSNMTASVGKEVSSITINASPEDGGSSISGIGPKTLSYGKNTFTITVTAPSGATKNYTITITREDPRSSNNNLSSLKVSGGTISPSFNKNTTTYTMTVPFSIENLDIKATPDDKKATVSVTGNKGLKAEATTDVLVKVTAENGSTKTYTIKVTREKDPNKPKSDNNYLESLTTNIGILSPVFNKEKLNYVIYLPYEVDTIELTAAPEDKQFGVIEKSGPEKLNVGTNTYTFKVTTEDGSTRVYTVNVLRGQNLENTTNGNTLLKDIKITSGSLETKFDPNVFVYRYNKKKSFNIEPIPEDENTSVKVIEHEDIYTILLENASGETNVYTLIPKEKSQGGNNIILIALVCASLPLIGGGTFIGYRIGLKKMIKKVKSLKIKETENSIEKEPNPNKKEKKKKKTKKEELADQS